MIEKFNKEVQNKSNKVKKENILNNSERRDRKLNK